MEIMQEVLFVNNMANRATLGECARACRGQHADDATI